MDITEELRAFVATAQTGSFTAAADQLGVSNRLTSKYVAELEARLGVRLLQRTTRRVGLTPAGADLLARAPALLDDLDDLLAGVSEGSRGFSGGIRLSAPVTLGEIYVGGMLARFAAAHPGLHFDLRLSDRFVDLARDGIDVAFRIGRSDMLSLKARRLGESRTVVVASPAYLAAHGTPAQPEDLVRHDCIVDTNRQLPRRWQFHAGGALREGAVREVTVQGRFHVNSARAAAELAIAGLGIAHAPRFAVCGALETGALVPVLTGFDSPPSPVSAVYLEGRVLPRKLRALIDFAAEDIRHAGIL
ncbi:LysR family transcriptional regulator [Rhodobacter capsulatus]|uniref:DNA-binding transcriptional regulator, LysR family n=1 Tax=Rhodobacter capsulatus TaxID=1061 RepID=A0A1G7IIR0_RHOCA|nr:LysR family transcriptional regulator [Rhodobacter capsulatus]WER10233.1 LysR family transcriptional regulator [Rhodobacter capsulatus]SDF12592.1 DNA-binding transcriptional regulator, LysR family [Rhodobacter capsulatus]